MTRTVISKLSLFLSVQGSRSFKHLISFPVYVLTEDLRTEGATEGVLEELREWRRPLRKRDSIRDGWGV